MGAAPSASSSSAAPRRALRPRTPPASSSPSSSSPYSPSRVVTKLPPLYVSPSLSSVPVGSASYAPLHPAAYSPDPRDWAAAGAGSSSSSSSSSSHTGRLPAVPTLSMQGSEDGYDEMMEITLVGAPRRQNGEPPRRVPVPEHLCVAVGNNDEWAAAGSPLRNVTRLKHGAWRFHLLDPAAARRIMHEIHFFADRERRRESGVLLPTRFNPLLNAWLLACAPFLPALRRTAHRQAEVHLQQVIRYGDQRVFISADEPPLPTTTETATAAPAPAPAAAALPLARPDEKNSMMRKEMQPEAHAARMASAAAEVKHAPTPAHQLRLVGAYYVQYEPDAHPAIPPHTDDNDVTLNVCIGDVFHDGALSIHHLQKERQRNYAQGPGLAFLHTGKTTHSTTPVSEGLRANLVVKFKWYLPEAESKTSAQFLRWNDLFGHGKLHTFQLLDIGTLSCVAQCSRALNLATSEAPLWRSIWQRDPYFNAWMPYEQLEKAGMIERTETWERLHGPFLPSPYEYKVSLSGGWRTAYKSAWHAYELIEQRKLRNNNTKFQLSSSGRRRRMLTGTFSWHERERRQEMARGDDSSDDDSDNADLKQATSDIAAAAGLRLDLHA